MTRPIKIDYSWKAAAFLAVGFMLLLISCATGATEDLEPETVPSAVPTLALIDAQPYFVQGQAIVFGDSQSDITDAVGKAAKKLGLSIDLISDEEGEGQITTEAETIIQLYEIEGGGATVEQTIDAILAIDGHAAAFAEPNYHIGSSSTSACGDPFTVAGSPFTVAGSPFTVAGSPFTVAGSPHASGSASAEPSEFWVQWGYDQLGDSSSGIQIEPGDDEGGGYRIGVFDTAPFPDGEKVIDSTEMGSPFPLIMQVRHSGALALAALNTFEDLGDVPTISDHGLFVTSLAFGLAEASEYHLIEALNEYGCGHLFALVVEMHKFIKGTTDLSGTVLNLSLGFPDYSQVETITNEDGKPLEDLIGSARFKRLINLFGLGVRTLEGAIGAALESDFHVVASAGNEYGNLPNLPAAWPNVIGVMAGTKDVDLACYTSVGEFLILAPGGAGDSSDPCEPNSAVCQSFAASNPGQCPFGVVGKMIGENEYAYWAGSSFSAAFVSGWIARIGLAPGNGVVDASNEWVNTVLYVP